jgi:methionyl aminopeptidase
VKAAPRIVLKTSEEVAGIRASCRAAAEVLRAVGESVAEGVSTRELDRLAARRIRELGAEPAVDRRFPGSLCLSVNEVAAHGAPSDYRLAEGDIVTVDVAVRLGGWCGDAAATFAAGQAGERAQELVAWARRALRAGLGQARAGLRLGDVGAAIQREASEGGDAVLVELVGHGIGAALHEDPEVPPAGLPGQGLPIVPGMVFTVEPAVCRGSGSLEVGEDGWCLRTADRSPVAQFEHTVAVFRDRTEVLTDSGLY